MDRYEKINELVNVAENSRYKCTCCEYKINKGEKYFRDAKQSYRSSHTVNLCYKCIAMIFLRSGIRTEELEKITNEIMIKRIEGDEE